MSFLKNAGNWIVPLRERRQVSGTLGALNSELIIPTNGDASVTLHCVSNALIGTLEFTGASDNGGATVNGAPVGNLYLPCAAFPDSIACAGGTVPLASQPMLVDALVAANTTRRYVIPCGGLSSVRVRMSAYTSGNCVLTANSDVNEGVIRGIEYGSNSLCVTGTAAVSTALTITLPAVAGFRHVISSLKVKRSATAALTAAATPVVVTTTNIQGSPALTFGSDAGGVGVDKDESLDCGNGLMTTTLGTATTVVMPIYTGVIWRCTVVYRLSR